jgi:hypothetical protein
VINAASVTVVDMRQRLVPVVLHLPSANPANTFAARVSFQCRVREAETVVATHAEIHDELLSYLRQDRKLRLLSGGYSHDQLNEARNALAAQIEARFVLRPLEVEGLDIAFGDVEVLTPNDLANFERERQAVARRQAIETLNTDFDRQEAKLIEEILNRGPQAIEALAIRLGEVTVANSTTRGYAEQEKATNRLLSMMSTLAEYGHTDRLPIDTTVIIDQILANITGKPISTRFDEPAIGTADKPREVGSRAKDDADSSGEWLGGSDPQAVDDDY